MPHSFLRLTNYSGFVKTNLLRSNTVVGLREDSPYSQFKLVSAAAAEPVSG